MSKFQSRYEIVKVDKLVHGGQALATLDDGRKLLLWNGLPGEDLKVRLTRSKRDFAEGIAEEVISSSKHRVDSVESVYLATSPWQIIDFDQENIYKSQILTEAFRREGLDIGEVVTRTDGKDYNYRNKMEFSFYGDDQGLHFAFYNRGSHQKQIVVGSALAMDSINTAAKDILAILNKLGTRAGDLKSLILRSNQAGRVVGALFIKLESFDQFELPDSIDGLKIYHSNPKSPASVTTRLLHQVGDSVLTDELLGRPISYGVTGFFQVNLPVFNLVLEQIKRHAGELPKVDMYSGVGSIGLSLSNTRSLVELDPDNVAMAEHNANGSTEVILASSEQALDYVTDDICLIVDPPRSGLHKALVEKILAVRPPKVVYLSCNPSTQARDVALLSSSYKIKFIEGYNFFPHTPHIESLCILEAHENS